MFRSMYDTDITTWSPAGRLYQLDYALETVKQGSATVGLKSKTHVVIAALKRSPTAELSSHQEKIFKVADHMGISVTGLLSDARHLARFMRTEAMNAEYMTGSAIPVNRLVEDLALKHQRHTQSASKRPFGVGLLVGGFDEQTQTARLYQTAPTGDFFDYKATAIGSHSQSARTYLERHYTTFNDCTLDQLVAHAVKALANTVGETNGTQNQLTTKNTSIAIVGLGYPFQIYTDDSVRKFLGQDDGFKLHPADVVPVEQADDGEE